MLLRIAMILLVVALTASCVGVISDHSENTVNAVAAKTSASFAGVVSGGAVSHDTIWVKFKPATGGSGEFIYRAYLGGSEDSSASLDSYDALIDDEGYIKMMIGGLEYNRVYRVKVRIYDSVYDRNDDNNVSIQVATSNIFLPVFSGVGEVANASGSSGMTQLIVKWSQATAPNVTVGNPFDSIHTVSGYNVYYSSSLTELRQVLEYKNQHSIPIINFPNSKVISVSGAMTSQLTISGLTPGVQYYVAVRARQSSTPIPYYELNWKILSNSTYLTQPFAFDGVFSLESPSNISGFSTLTVSWNACTGCTRYQIYVRPLAITGDIDTIVDAAYLAKTITSPSTVTTDVSGGLISPNTTYNCFVVACKTDLCLETKGNEIYQAATTIPEIAPLQGATAADMLSIDFPSGVYGLTQLNLNFDVDTTRGYYTKLKVYRVIDKANPPTSRTDLDNSSIVTLLGRTPGAAGVPYINSAETLELSYSNNLSSARIAGLTTDAEYCFIVIPTIGSPDITGDFVALDPSKWPAVTCGTATYTAPDFGGTTPNPQCAGVQSTKVTISWTPPVTPGIFTHYEIYYRNTDAAFDFDDAWAGDAAYTMAAKVDSSYTNLQISGLPPTTSYYFGINTYVNDGSGTIYRRTSNSVIATEECSTTIPTMTHNGFTEVFAIGPKTDGSNLRGNGVGAVVPENIDPINKNPREYNAGDDLPGATHGIVRLAWFDFELAGTSPAIAFSDVASSDSGYEVYRLSKDEVELAGLPESDVLKSSNTIWDVTATKLNFEFITYDTDKILAYTGGTPTSSVIPSSTGIALGAAKTFEFLDYPPKESRIYYYLVRAVSNGVSLEFSTPTAGGLVQKVTVPPKNMALVHRNMVNMEICSIMQRGLIRTEGGSIAGDGRSECNLDNNASADCVDTQNNYRCKFNGFGSTDIGGTKYYDIGYDMLVDRFELSCNTQDAGVTYDPSNGSCIGSDFSNGTGVSNNAYLPPLPYVYRTDGYDACENSLDDLKVSGDANFKLYDNDVATYSRRLLTKKEWHAAAAWDYYRIGFANIFRGIEQNASSTLIYSNRNCHTNSFSNEAVTLAGNPDGMWGNSYAQWWASNSGDGYDCYYTGSYYTCAFIGGSSGNYSTDDCVSRYGVQDMIGNVDEVSCSSETVENAEKGTGTITGLAFDGVTAIGVSNYFYASQYYNPTMGLPLICSAGSACSSDDKLIGNNNTNAPDATIILNNTASQIGYDYFYVGYTGVTLGGGRTWYLVGRNYRRGNSAVPRCVLALE